MTSNNIPSWLCEKQEYTPQSDNLTFAAKSTKALVKALSGFKRRGAEIKAKRASTPIRLFVAFAAILLTSLSKNFSFTFFMLAAVILRIAFLKAEKIKALLKVLFPCLILSLLILLPSAFLGNPKTPLNILSKIFVCISLVSVINLTSSFNEITLGLKSFHIPDIIIFTIDIAIKYIFILGDICVNMLTALKVRSIGKNSSKSTSASGILGTVFIKTKDCADDTAKAMECRGFCGEYPAADKKSRLSMYDFAALAALVAILIAYVYLEAFV